MSTQIPCYDDESIIDFSGSFEISYDFNCPDSPVPRTRSELGEAQASNKGKRPTVAEILSVLNPRWSTILLTSWVIAVLSDPLFFYIPYIKEEEKCMGIDKKVRTAALVFRSVTDITLLVHIIYQLREAIKFAASKVPRDTNSYEWERKSVYRAQMIIKFAKEFSRKLSWRSFLTDVFAIFPMPQVLIVIVFFGKRDFGYLDKKVLNIFLLIQYWPRICLLRRSFKELSTGILARVAFNFFLYLYAGYVLGALWYFISIQREMSCWYRTCINYSNACNTFHCDDDSSKNIILIDESCPMNPPNATVFDFGIFTNSLQSSSTGSVNFSTKMFYSFWWGLRNLSNFATNLETSNYLWENCFAILLSIAGLILFLYLIGYNVQKAMEKYKEVEVEQIRERNQRIQKKKQDIEKWMEKYGLQDDMKEEIMKNISKKLEEEEINGDLEDLFSILPWYTKKALKRVLCMSALRKVPMLSQMDEKVLKMMCDYLKPVNYPENTLVFQMGEPFDRMIFITEGLMWTYTTATESSHYGRATSEPATSPSMDTKFLKDGDSYGHALLQFASSSLAALPASDSNVRCHTKVEAFVLMARDLKNIVAKCAYLWPFDYNASKDEAADQQQLYMARPISEEVREMIRTKKNDIEKWMEKYGLQDDMKEEIMKNISKKLEEEEINGDLEDLFSILPWYTKKALKRVLCMSALRKVPMLSQMDEKVLKMMCDYLKPVNYPENTLVFQMGEPFDRMIFITEGLMWTYTTATESSHYGRATSEPATSPSMDTKFLKDGDSYGHALLQFASSSLAALPTSDSNVRCHTKVEAFVLMARDLKNIVAKCAYLWPFDYNASKDEAADQVAQLGQLPKKCVSTSTTGNRG